MRPWKDPESDLRGAKHCFKADHKLAAFFELALLAARWRGISLTPL